MTHEIIAPKGARYLSDFMDELPDHCLFDKSITGCGGTTIEIKSKHNSIIAVPTRNLAISKASDTIFAFIGKVTDAELVNYLNSSIQYKKIIITYDMLPKISAMINPDDFTLLIDEYHLLFNDYSFRSNAVQGVLNTYKKFKHWCFMTATPLSDECILQELSDVDRVVLKWQNFTKVKMHIIDTCQIIKKLLWMMEHDERNLHIFLNSIKTIQYITNELDTDDYRVLCSSKSASKIQNYALPTSSVKKYNFYTSCAFEGVDISDPDGVCVIISDTNICTTLMDISTKVRQICGRLRDSKYKDECYFILNTRKHRYTGVSKPIFQNRVDESVRLGLERQDLYNKAYDAKQMELECKLYSEMFTSFYLNKYNGKVFYDPNLKTIDEYNYRLVSEIYNSSINVLMECNKQTQFETDNTKVIVSNKGLNIVRDYLMSQTKDTYTYTELEEIFKPIFKDCNLKWTRKNSIKLYFPQYKKTVRRVNGELCTVYKFDL